MTTFIQKSTMRGTVPAPPSKSFAHRWMLGAALAEGTSHIRGIADSEDVRATLDCIRALGAECTLEAELLTVKGVAGRLPPTATLPCRESGSTLRFFLPLLPAHGGSATLTGTERLLARGIGVYEEIFAAHGVKIEKSPDTVCVSGKLPAGAYTLRGDVSSQFVTGMLYALTLTGGESTLRVLSPVESRPYIDITLSVLRCFGVNITETSPNTFHIPADLAFRARDAVVEGDWSNAAALLALGELGGDVTVTGLAEESVQGDRICREYFKKLRTRGAVLDLSGCPDLAPVLFAVAAANQGGVFEGTRRLAIKESDRAAAMAAELAKCGVRVEICENRVTVGGELHPPSEMLCGHNDHRIVMALSLLLTRLGGAISGSEAIRKSYPDFFEVLKMLGAEVRHEAG